MPVEIGGPTPEEMEVETENDNEAEINPTEIIAWLKEVRGNEHIEKAIGGEIQRTVGAVEAVLVALNEDQPIEEHLKDLVFLRQVNLIYSSLENPLVYPEIDFDQAQAITERLRELRFMAAKRLAPHLKLYIPRSGEIYDAKRARADENNFDLTKDRNSHEKISRTASMGFESPEGRVYKRAEVRLYIYLESKSNATISSPVTSTEQVRELGDQPLPLSQGVHTDAEAMLRRAAGYDD